MVEAGVREGHRAGIAQVEFDARVTDVATGVINVSA
jgi:hypothetical protein